MSKSSSFGIVIAAPLDLERLSGDDLRQLVFRHGWLLARGAHYDGPRFEALAAQLGDHIQYGFGKVLNMEALPESEESQFTNASMPLHQDAILNAENNAQFLLFRCLETTEGMGGETLLTDNRRFMQNMSDDLLETLRSVQFSYFPLTSGYYVTRDDNKEIRLPPLARHPETGEEVPHLALDDPDDARRNYAAVVAGYDEASSRALMSRIDCELRARDVLHAHEWQVGDILIIDNFLVCHGRNVSAPRTRRRLERIAIKARKAQVDDLREHARE